MLKNLISLKNGNLKHDQFSTPLRKRITTTSRPKHFSMCNPDTTFLETMDVSIVKYQTWQWGLFHPDLEGKFVWYPKKGTLMFDCGIRENSIKIGVFHDTEDVYYEIMKKVDHG